MAASVRPAAEWLWRPIVLIGYGVGPRRKGEPALSIVVRNTPRADKAVVEGFTGIGVATVHEAQGRM